MRIVHVQDRSDPISAEDRMLKELLLEDCSVTAASCQLVFASVVEDNEVGVYAVKKQMLFI